MRKLLIVAVALLAIACQFSPAERDRLIEEIDRLETREEITPQQAEFARRGVNDGSIDWGELARMGGSIAVSVLLAYFGIQRSRGPSKPMEPSEIATLRSVIEREKAHPRT